MFNLEGLEKAPVGRFPRTRRQSSVQAKAPLMVCKSKPLPGSGMRFAFIHCPAGDTSYRREGCLERRMVCGVPLPNHEGHIARVPCLAGAPNEPATA